MRTKYLFLLLFAVLLVRGQVLAQAGRRTIMGLVTTEGTPLEGVLVVIKGSTYFSGSQPDGVFYIPVSASDTVLVFSMEGYETQELKLSKTNEYNIALQKKCRTDIQHITLYATKQKKAICKTN